MEGLHWGSNLYACPFDQPPMIGLSWDADVLGHGRSDSTIADAAAWYESVYNIQAAALTSKRPAFGLHPCDVVGLQEPWSNQESHRLGLSLVGRQVGIPEERYYHADRDLPPIPDTSWPRRGDEQGCHALQEAYHHQSRRAANKRGRRARKAEDADATRRRRQGAHNAIERRRHEHINERIQALSRLVPPHASRGSTLSQPPLNSFPPPPLEVQPLVISLGVQPTTVLPLRYGDHNPRLARNDMVRQTLSTKTTSLSKSDILLQAVHWMFDLTMTLHEKYQGEVELAEYIQSIGGRWPYHVSEDEARMRTEIANAMGQVERWQRQSTGGGERLEQSGQPTT